MTHQFQIRCDNPANLDEARRKLGTVTCDGKNVFGFDKSEDDSIYVGCPLHETIAEDSQIVVDGGNMTSDFYDVFYMIDATKSGFHHPDGALWVQNGTHAVHYDKVSVLDVFPTLLDHFRVALPVKQGCAYRGRSLLPLLDGIAEAAVA
jgi:hypothetical protein